MKVESMRNDWTAAAAAGGTGHWQETPRGNFIITFIRRLCPARRRGRAGIFLHFSSGAAGAPADAGARMFFPSRFITFGPETSRKLQ